MASTKARMSTIRVKRLIALLLSLRSVIVGDYLCLFVVYMTLDSTSVISFSSGISIYAVVSRI